MLKLDRVVVLRMFAVLLIMFGVTACTSLPTTSEGIKAWVQQPFPLLLLMLIASAGSAFKQMRVASRAGTGIPLGQYFIEHWPETLIMLGTNVGAWFAMIMTDTLNWQAAIGIGYIANDAADVFTKTGRSAAVSVSSPAIPLNIP